MTTSRTSLFPCLTAQGTLSSVAAERHDEGRWMDRQRIDDLVKRAQAGDTDAFAQLFRRHRGQVARLAGRMLSRDADVEDAVQDVFVQVHRSLPDFRGNAKFSTWLHRVAVNVVLMTRRRAQSRPRYSDEEAGRHEPDPGPLPDGDVTRARRLAAFRRALDRLSEKKRTVFILHELEGMVPADISKVVGAPVLTVRTRLFYARRELAGIVRADPELRALVGEGGASGRSTLGAGRSKRRHRGRRATADAEPIEPCSLVDEEAP